MSRLLCRNFYLPAMLGMMVAAVTLTPVAVFAQSMPSADHADKTSRAPRPSGPRGAAETAPASGGNVASGGEGGAGQSRDKRAGIPADTAVPQRPLQLSSADRKLMRELARAHQAEIRLSGLATALSDNRAVRSYAEKMLEDHSKGLDELRQLAGKSGTVLPGGVRPEQAALLQQLTLLFGANFNQLYLAQAGGAAQEQLHQLFEQAGMRAQAPELKAYAGRFAPVIGENLQLAQQMMSDPARAAGAVRSEVRAGQSASIDAPAGAASNRAGSNGAARGSANISGTAVGQGK